MIFRKSILSPFLTYRLKCAIISHKFYFGQGGELQFDLTKRTYNISIETIWEDYSSLEIQGLTGASNFTLYEQEGVSYFRDEDLQPSLKENIEVKLRVPEDYTIRGIINGNIAHGSGPVGKKMRSKPFSLELLGDNREMALGDLKSEQISLVNRDGTIWAPNLTVQAGSIESKTFKSQKLMTSGSISLNCLSIVARSIIMFGKSHGTFTSRDIEIESISGASHINCEGSLKIERYYGGTNDVNIKCKGIKDKVGVQSGTGKVQFPSQEDARQGENKVVLGRMHKGKLERHGNVILIC